MGVIMLDEVSSVSPAGYTGRQAGRQADRQGRAGEVTGRMRLTSELTAERTVVTMGPQLCSGLGCQAYVAV